MIGESGLFELGILPFVAALIVLLTPAGFQTGSRMRLQEVRERTGETEQE